MGIALWMLCGVVVFVATRTIAVARPSRFIGELFVALFVAFLAGLGATAFDFGGWNEVDWRAGAFVICCGFAAIGAMRLIGLFRRSATQS